MSAPETPLTPVGWQLRTEAGCYEELLHQEEDNTVAKACLTQQVRGVEAHKDTCRAIFLTEAALAREQALHNELTLEHAQLCAEDGSNRRQLRALIGQSSAGKVKTRFSTDAETTVANTPMTTPHESAAIMYTEKKAALREALRRAAVLAAEEEAFFVRAQRRQEEGHAFQLQRLRALQTTLAAYHEEETIQNKDLTRFLNTLEASTQGRQTAAEDTVSRLKLELEEKSKVLTLERNRREEELEDLCCRVRYMEGIIPKGVKQGSVEVTRRKAIESQQRLTAKETAEEEAGAARKAQKATLKKKVAALSLRLKGLEGADPASTQELEEIKAALYEAEERLGESQCILAKGRMARHHREAVSAITRYTPKEQSPGFVFS